jgi:hypothetical protein
LDFAKALDTVPHERLKKKLKAHGVMGKLLQWIAAWLRERKQRVVLNGESIWEELLSSVPHGSVPGLLLFLIFINDLDLAVSLDELLVKFADDTKLARIVKSDEDRLKLKLALENLVKWTHEWGMLFNIKKCKVMHLGCSNQKSEYSMDSVKLEVTKAEKDLGILITDNLKPGAQCTMAAKMAQSVLGQKTRTFRYGDRRVFLQLYKQYVRPHLKFAVQAWSP